MAGETDDFDPGGNTRSFSPGASGSLPTADSLSGGFDPGGNTRSILGTAYETVPRTDAPGKSWWNTPVSESMPPVDRVIDKAAEAWRNRPDFWTPQGRAALERPLEGAPPVVKSLLNPTVSGLTRGIIEPAGDLVSGALGAGGALFRGGQQAVQEVATPIGGPQFGRDMAALPEAFPISPGFVRPRYAMPEYAGYPTHAGARTVASNFYKIADTDNTVISPTKIDSALDAANPRTPRDVARDVTTGDTAVTAQLRRLENFRGKPMSVQEWQGLNEGLGEAISNEYSAVDGMSPAGRRLGEIQRTLRDQIQNATPDDLVSGSGKGLDAIKQGNEAYTQAKKLEVIEKMQRNAELSNNRTTSMQQQIRTFLKSDAKTRGWSDAELAALEDASTRGAWGNIAHVLGNPVSGVAAAVAAPIASMAHGTPSLTSMALAPVAGAVPYLLGAPFRGLANVSQLRRLQNAMDVLGQKVPPNPLGLPEVP